MQDITNLSKTEKEEIAGYIKRDNLRIVNEKFPRGDVKKSFYTCYGKRLFDIAFSLIVLVLTFPVNIVIAIVTFFDVGTPIIFKQKRMGREQKVFTIYKFRNMTNETDANGELLPATVRVTKWGEFVRKTSLDELLNFVAILKGEMSVIGPRPLLDSYNYRLSEQHKMIYAVRPGLECPTLQRLDHPMSWQERLDNYVWYVENCSFTIDIKLMFRVVQVALDGKSIAQRASASHGGFLGYEVDGSVIYTKTVPDRFVDEFCRNHGYANLEEAFRFRESAITLEQKSVQEKKVV